MSQKSIPILDFDALITAIQALSAPSGTDVAISPTGMHIVTEDDAQGAISELDAGLYATNLSLTQYIKRKTVTIPNADLSAGAYLTNYLVPDTGYAYLCYTSIASVGWVLTFPMYIDEASKRIWYSGTPASGNSIKVEFLEIKTLS